MYFKLWIINIIIGIIFYEICYSKTCCCSEKCQKNDSNKIEVDRSKERFRRESGNESQSIICPSPPHCPMLNYSKQNYSELSPRPKRPSTKLFLSSNCPPFKCPQPPPCPEKTCPSSLPRQAEKICTPPPPCLKKVCPPPPPCPKTVCPILTPLPLSHSDKPCPPPSPPCPSMTQRSDNGYDFKNVSEKEEKRKSKEMVNVNSRNIY